MDDEVVRANRLRGGFHLGIRGRQPPETDIIHDRSVEQERVLQYHAHLPAQGSLRDERKSNPVDRMQPAVGSWKRESSLDQGGLACAGLADQGDGLAGG